MCIHVRVRGQDLWAPGERRHSVWERRCSWGFSAERMWEPTTEIIRAEISSEFVLEEKVSFFQLQQACLSRCFQPGGSPRWWSSWNQQTASSERSWGERSYSSCAVVEEQALIFPPHKTFSEFAAVIVKNCVKRSEWMLNLNPVIHCIGEWLKLSSICCWYSVFCFSACFQTLCCTAWAVSTFWFYTGSCLLTHSWWTGPPCRLQVTHTDNAQGYTSMSSLHVLCSSFQMKCLCISEFQCSPVLSTFPLLMDQPDLLDALRVRCKEKKRILNFL